MSIYASLHAPNDLHADTCAVWRERPDDPGVLEWSGEPCDCGLPEAPIVYQGSHVLPSDDDERGGHVDIAAIPGHIDRAGRPPTNPDDEFTPYHPWLRLSVWEVVEGSATVVLDRRGVELLYRTLGEWLEGTRDD